MFGILAKIFGSGEVVKAGLDLIDDIHTSTEEEVKAKSQAKIDLLRAYEPFKLAQRYIAFAFTGVYLLCFALVLGFNLSDRVTDADTIKQTLEDFQIGYAMLIILTFYFGGGFAEGVLNKRKADK